MQASGGEGQSTVMEQFALADASETPGELLEREEPLSALVESLQAMQRSSRGRVVHHDPPLDPGQDSRLTLDSASPR